MLPILLFDLIVSATDVEFIVESDYLRYIHSLWTRHAVLAACATDVPRLLVFLRNLIDEVEFLLCQDA